MIDDLHHRTSVICFAFLCFTSPPPDKEPPHVEGIWRVVVQEDICYEIWVGTNTVFFGVGSSINIYTRPYSRISVWYG